MTIFSKNLVSTVALFYTFTNLSVCLKQRKLDLPVYFCVETIVPRCFGWWTWRKFSLKIRSPKKEADLIPTRPPGVLTTLRTSGAEIQNILVAEETNYLKMFPTLDFCLEYKSLSMVSVRLNDGLMPFYEISGLLHIWKLPVLLGFPMVQILFLLNNLQLMALVFNIKSTLTTKALIASNDLVSTGPYSPVFCAGCRVTWGCMRRDSLVK